MIISGKYKLNIRKIARCMILQDYAVKISPKFWHRGEIYQVIMEGHEALQAARNQRIEPEFSIASGYEVEDLNKGEINSFLLEYLLDGPYHNVYTKVIVDV